MTSLGDIFPDQWKQQLAHENLKVGAVIRIHVPDTTPPKIKRLIVVGIEQGKALLATIFINTDINPKVINTTALQHLQYRLTTTSCVYLDHDSYADCSQLKERDFKAIQELIATQPSAHLGQLSDFHLAAIHTLVKSAKTISPRLKKKYGLLL